MAGPIRTGDPSPDNRPTVQPPRPPNAWILYRSDKLRELPPPAPNQPRRAQADVSKLISHMWKHETEYVRAEYERLADMKKAEHQALYPGYRFQPMKKEEKERLREEKRLEKEKVRANSKRRPRPAPYAPPAMYMPANIPHPLAAYYQTPPDTPYGPFGPSPPVSAASSPEEPTTPEDQPTQIPASSHASPRPDSRAAVATKDNGALFILPPPPSYVPTVASTQAEPSQAQAPNQWGQQPQQSLGATDGQQLSSPPNAPLWNNFQNEPTGQSQNDLLFTLPDNPVQPWMTDDYFTGALQTFLTKTGDSSIFQMSNYPTDIGTEFPSVPIVVSSDDDIVSGLSGAEFDFSQFDFSSIAGPSSQPIDNLSPTQPSDSNSMFQSNAPQFASSTPSSDQSTYEFSYNMEEFLNFDDNLSVIDPVLQNPPEQRVVSDSTNTTPPRPTRSPYVPPSGAAHSSTRRVAASWKASFAMATDDDHNTTPRPWVVPAS